MENPNVIVSKIIRIEPAIEKFKAADILRQNPDGISIVFEDNKSVRLLPGKNAEGILEILEELRKMELPAYIEFVPDKKSISRLLIPLVARVESISEKGDEVMIKLDRSHAIHFLNRKNQDFNELLETLRSAKEKNSWVALTETDSHEVINIRLWPYEPKIPKPDLELPRKSFWDWFRKFFCWFFNYWCCVSAAKAQKMFDLVSAKTCNPLTVPAPCIPFLYPDDGCWARAHEMCRLMINAGRKPKKVWIDGWLITPTKNHPNCQVVWGWHVAPTLCVRQRFWHTETMVIDPSLFTTPVSKSTWKSVQGDPGATLTDSSASLYWRYSMPSDPGYVDTNYRLDYYRLQLKNRSLGVNGPPPYANCP